MTDVILTADIGTTAVKVCAFALDGRLLAHQSEAHQTVYTDGGRAEQNALDWLDGFIQATRRLFDGSAQPLRAVAIGLTGQMAACLPVAADGKPLHPALIWSDQRAVAEAEAEKALVGEEEAFRLTGNPISPMYLAAKAAWLQKEYPDVYRRTKFFLQPSNFVAHFLTGAMATDYSQASCTGLFDMGLRQWSESLARAMGLAIEKLPPVVPAATSLGTLTTSAATALGISGGIPVVVGGGDGPATAVGVGALEDGTGYIYVGSSAWMSLTASSPFSGFDRGIVNYIHLDPMLYAQTGSMQAAGTALTWAAHALFPDELAEPAIERLGSLGSRAVHRDLLFLPYLLGERAPYWDAKARSAFVGLTVQHSTADLCAAVIEGVALHLRVIGDVFGLEGLHVDTLPAVGGGMRVRGLAQAIADALGLPIGQIDEHLEATSRGAFVAAAIALGLLPDYAAARGLLPLPSHTCVPDARRAQRLARLLPLFRQAYAGLQPVFAALAESGTLGS